ncbi:MAG: hypothetical protein LWX83_10745, partial [Anaerolineae bacterium]|nr:hypothetical protein [Anaerolineae bacterium]
MKNSFNKLIFVLAGLLILQLACGLSIFEKTQNTPTVSEPTETGLPPSATSAPATATSEPSATFTPLPTA